MASGTVRGDVDRRDPVFNVAVGFLVLWVVLVVVFGVALFLENKVRAGAREDVGFIGACQVPGSSESTYGRGVWQSWPPGTRCERRGLALDVAPSTPRVWARPQAWRGGAVVVLVASGVVIAVAVYRSRERGL